jgi:streptogramin lyase
VIRRLRADGQVAFGIGFPDATAVTWSSGAIVVGTRAGNYVLSVEGKILERPAAAPAVPFSSDHRFTRLASSGGALETLWNGRTFGCVDGVWSEYRNSRFEPLPGLPKLTGTAGFGDSIAGLVHLPSSGRWALQRSDHPGLGLSHRFLAVPPTSSQALDDQTDIPYEGLVAAASKSHAAWVTNAGVKVRDAGGEEQVLPSPGSVLRLHYREDQLWAAGTRDPDGKSPFGFAAKWSGAAWEDAPCAAPSPITAIGSQGDTLWLGGDGFLTRFEAGICTSVPSPLTRIQSFWAESAKSLWLAGDGGVAHLDGAQMRRVAGPFGNANTIAGTKGGDVLVATTQGLFRGRKIDQARRSEAFGLSVAVTAPALEPDAALDVPLPLEARDDDRYRAQVFALPRLFGKPYRPHSMTFVGGEMWLSDGRVATTFAPGQRTLDVKYRSPIGSRCTRCVAAANGRTATVLGGTLAGVGTSTSPSYIRSLRADGDGLWFVADRDPATADPLRSVASPFIPEAQLFHLARNGTSMHVGLPAATYFDLATSKDGTLWLAGVRSPDPRYRSSNSYAISEEGEGLLVRYSQGQVTQYRLLPGPVFAVDTDSRGAVWAVGVAGQIWSVTDKLHGFELPQRPWLRAVVASAPNDVWVAGDRSTLLRFDGSSWRRIRAKELVADQSLTALAVDPKGRLWVLGQNVVYRIEMGQQ